MTRIGEVRRTFIRTLLAALAILGLMAAAGMLSPAGAKGCHRCEPHKKHHAHARHHRKAPVGYAQEIAEPVLVEFRSPTAMAVGVYLGTTSMLDFAPPGWQPTPAKADEVLAVRFETAVPVSAPRPGTPDTGTDPRVFGVMALAGFGIFAMFVPWRSRRPKQPRDWRSRLPLELRMAEPEYEPAGEIPAFLTREHRTMARVRPSPVSRESALPQSPPPESLPASSQRSSRALPPPSVRNRRTPPALP